MPSCGSLLLLLLVWFVLAVVTALIYSFLFSFEVRRRENKEKRDAQD